ncbi:MAG: CPBP family intramembrane glutamic endopeptidase [Halobacteriota archaeon]
MKFTLGCGKISSGQLLAAMLFAKILGILFLIWLETSLLLHKNFATLFSRACELLMFVGLVACMYAPHRLPVRAICIPSDAPVDWRKMSFIAGSVIVVAVMSRYAIEILMLMLALAFDPELIDDAHKITPIAKNSVDPLWGALLSGNTIAQLTVVPIVEEFIYRGVVLNVLLTRYKIINSLLISSLIFAVFHGNPVAAFFGGMLFGHIYLLTGNIAYAVLGHSAANATIVLLYNGPNVLLPLSYDQMTSGTVGILFIAAFSWLATFLVFTISCRGRIVLSAFQIGLRE